MRSTISLYLLLYSHVSDLSHPGACLKLTENTWTPKCKAQISAWLDVCRSHSNCESDWQTESEYTFRLLNIRPVPTKEGRVRLEVCKASEKRRKYATMSHRWNTGVRTETFKLTRENITHLMDQDGFSVDELPQKFKDAIEITQWMGISYLWRVCRPLH
jgi:hypothetical protein